MLYFLHMLYFLCFCLVCGLLSFTCRRRVQVIDENAAGRRLALGGHFRESVHVRVLLPWDVVELQAPKSPFQLADLLTVCVHELALAVGVFHDLVDY